MRVLLGGPVEGLGDGRAPVDDHRVAVGVVDVPAADVEALALGALGLLGAGGVQIVEAAEEERGVGEVGERLDAGVDLALQDLGVDPVRGDVADVEGLGVLAHGAQGGAGGGEVGALPRPRGSVRVTSGSACVRRAVGVRHGVASGADRRARDAGVAAGAVHGAVIVAGSGVTRAGRFPSGRRHSRREAADAGILVSGADGRQRISARPRRLRTAVLGPQASRRGRRRPESYAKGTGIPSVGRCAATVRNRTMET